MEDLRITVNFRMSKVFTYPSFLGLTMKKSASNVTTSVKEFFSTSPEETAEVKNENIPQYENLPDPVLLKIFRYLDLKDISRAGGACSRWYNISRSSSLWENFEVSISSSAKLLKMLRSIPNIRIKSIRVSSIDARKVQLLFPEIIKTLKIRFPNLDFLSIDTAMLFPNEDIYVMQTGCLVPFHEAFRVNARGERDFTTTGNMKRYIKICYPSCSDRQAIYPVEKFSTKINKLSIRNSVFPTKFFYNISIACFQNVEILDLSYCPCIIEEHMSTTSAFPNLKELYVAGCPLTDKGIVKILNAHKNLKKIDIEETIAGHLTCKALNDYGSTLEELYIGGTTLTAKDIKLIVRSKILKSLKVICFENTRIDEKDFNNVVQTNSSIEIKGKPVFSDNKKSIKNCDHFLKNNA